MERLREIKAAAIERAHLEVTSGVLSTISPRVQQQPSIAALRSGWIDELEEMHEFANVALSNASIARELDGWMTPFWRARRRALAHYYSHTSWWPSTTMLYRLWNDARRGFPTIERYVKPAATTGFRLKQAADALVRAMELIERVRDAVRADAARPRTITQPLRTRG